MEPLWARGLVVSALDQEQLSEPLLEPSAVGLEATFTGVKSPKRSMTGFLSEEYQYLLSEV